MNIQPVTSGKVAAVGQYWQNIHGEKPLVLRVVVVGDTFLRGYDRGKEYTVVKSDYEPMRSRGSG